MIERLRVQIPAEAAEEYSTPELTFCADSYSVSVAPLVTAVARERPRSLYQQCGGQVSPKRVHTLDPTKSEWAAYAVQALCRKLSGKRAHMQPVTEHTATVVSALWIDPGGKEWNLCAQAFHFKTNNNKKAQTGNESPNLRPKPSQRGKSHHHLSPPVSYTHLRAHET